MLGVHFVVVFRWLTSPLYCYSSPLLMRPTTDVSSHMRRSWSCVIKCSHGSAGLCTHPWDTRVQCDGAGCITAYGLLVMNSNSQLHCGFQPHLVWETKNCWEMRELKCVMSIEGLTAENTRINTKVPGQKNCLEISELDQGSAEPTSSDRP